MNIKYDFIREESLKSFVSAVNEKIKDGWLFHSDYKIKVVGTNISYFQSFYKVVK